MKFTAILTLLATVSGAEWFTEEPALAQVDLEVEGSCSINEAKNKYGANRCRSSNECAGRRYCSSS